MGKNNWGFISFVLVEGVSKGLVGGLEDIGFSREGFSEGRSFR